MSQKRPRKEFVGPRPKKCLECGTIHTSSDCPQCKKIESPKKDKNDD